MIYYLTVTNRRIRTRMYGGVGGKARKGLPIPIQKVKKLELSRLDTNDRREEEDGSPDQVGE
jgi:hypothetical protein